MFEIELTVVMSDGFDDNVTFYLKKILNSKVFAKSIASGQLLEFLVENSLAKRQLKEFIISEEFFKKNDDGRTRVYVHNLRKKLNLYYQTEGDEDKLRFVIHKGQYNISFVTNKHETNKQYVQKHRRWLVRILFIVLFSTAFFISIQHFFNKSEKTLIQKHPVWETFLSGNESVIIVLGDHFFFTGKLPFAGDGMLRSARINSNEDLLKYTEQNDSLSENYRSLDYTYLNKNGPVCLFNIIQYFRDIDKVKFKLCSELTYDDIKNNHIIYFGSYKSVGLLSSVITNEHYNYVVEDGTVVYHNSEIDSTFYLRYGVSEQRLVEYPLVIKTRTSYEKKLLAFMCINDAGNIASLNYFLQPDSLIKIEALIPVDSGEDNFKALFKVKSLERTDMSIKLLYGESID